MRTRTTTARDVVTLTAQFRSDGFEPGTPASLPSWARQVDQNVCREAQCGCCGALGLVYRPFRRRSDYRALAVCPACDFAEEF